MEISFRVLSRYNALHSYKATENRVIETIDNFLEHLEFEHSYKDLSEDIVRGKVGDDRWSSIGFTLLFTPLILYIFFFTIFLPDYRRAPFALAIYGTLFICGIFAFVMRLHKEEWVWFYNKRNEVAFTIKILPDKRDETERLIQYIKNKIKEQR